MNRKDLIITITSADRPGIVEEVTEILLGHGANLEESRMARLGGEFAGIMRASVQEDRATTLASALRGLEDKALNITSKIAEPLEAERFTGYVPHEITVSGADHEGIVHSIAGYLADQGINIEELSTEVINAPVTGTPLFSMRAVVEAPPALSTAAFRANLEQVAEEMGVDIELKLVL
jgi:glycine cleavage system transcriptional repressor